MGNAELRRSQIVTTFGPGAMLDLPKESVIVAGLEHWHYDNGRIPTVEEPRLVEKLQTLLEKPTITLRTPPPTSDRPNAPPTDITAWKFPHWCLVQEESQHTNGTRKRRLVHANSLDGGEYRDGATRRKLAVVPIRFVRACNHGHVGDIDWKAFVHEAKTDCMRQMWFEERGTSGDLDQVWVACECGAVKLGKRVTAKGAVTPTSLAGSKVTLVLQKKTGGRWRQVKSTTRTIAANGSYSWKYKPAKKGSYRMRASIAKTAVYVAAATKWRAFKVK